MTVKTETPVTLDEVRDRFVQAESSLNDLIDGLESLRSSSDRFDDVRAGLDESRAQLRAVADQITGAAQGIATSIALIRQGIAMLEKSEPGRVLSELERLGGVVDHTNAAIRESVDGLARGIPTILERVDSVAQEMPAIRESVERSAAQIGVDLTTLRALVEEAGAKDASRVSVVQRDIGDVAATHAAALRQIEAAVQALAGRLEEQRATVERESVASATGRRNILTTVAAATLVIALLELVLHFSR